MQGACNCRSVLGSLVTVAAGALHMRILHVVSSVTKVVAVTVIVAL
jgi:hypothetical protein